MTLAGGRAGERGFALLIVLWSMVLLALLVTHLTSAGRGEARLAANVRLASVMQAAADGAINEAVFHVLDSSAGHWAADGAVHEISRPGAVVGVRISNEAGKVNLNTAQPEVLEGLLHAVGVDTPTAAAITPAIVAWRFPDAQGGRNARAPQYRAAGRDYGPPGAPFQSLEELGLVLGMTPDILARVEPYLSIYHDGEPDLRIAAAPVLQAFREAGGGAAVVSPDAATPVAETVVSITADAGGPDGGRFVRRAIVKVGEGSRGALFQILTWDTVDG